MRFPNDKDLKHPKPRMLQDFLPIRKFVVASWAATTSCVFIGLYLRQHLFLFSACMFGALFIYRILKIKKSSECRVVVDDMVGLRGDAIVDIREGGATPLFVFREWCNVPQGGLADIPLWQFATDGKRYWMYINGLQTAYAIKALENNVIDLRIEMYREYSLSTPMFTVESSRKALQEAIRQYVREYDRPI